MLYTYGVPFDFLPEIAVGKRVIVQFGKKRFYTAIVAAIHQKKPLDYSTKAIDSVLDENPIVNTEQLNYWQWIADFYVCNIGEVMNAAIPSGLKLSSETYFVYIENDELEASSLSKDEQKVLEALKHNDILSLTDIQHLLGKKSVYNITESLMQKRLMAMQESLKDKYKPKQVKVISLNPLYEKLKAQKELFSSLEKNEKQIQVLLQYLQLKNQYPEIEKRTLLKNDSISPSSLNTLIRKNVFIEKKKIVSRVLKYQHKTSKTQLLSTAQEIALNEVKEGFNENKVCALHGVTGSGKTHIYIQLIEACIKKDKSVLYLLPEIALTTQIVGRLQHYFGDKVVVYHSKFNEQERVEVYFLVLNKKAKIILAARSGVFLPFKNLGLIIVDEEHDRTYKQQNPAPRYHARDAAIILAKQFNANILLGTATLSFETFYNIENGKYIGVYLRERFGKGKLPDIELVDTLSLKKKKEIQGLFSPLLKTAIKDALEQKKQIILFQNRRGFATYANCSICNWIPYCPNCDVSLTYHKFFNKLVCHYCSFQEKMIHTCKACGNQSIEMQGFGTEQIEDDIQIMYPNVSVARLDIDTTRRKHGIEEILFAFKQKEIDILIGTQMVTKGLDFDDVSVVGVIHADQLWSFPDFRSSEKAYQLLAQVAGRAGRKDENGRVIIQAHDTKNVILQSIKNKDELKFYTNELLTRKQYHYPPYKSIILVDIKHKDSKEVQSAANHLFKQLLSYFGEKVLGPSIPLVSRIRNYYILQIMLKVEKNNAYLKESKKQLLHCINKSKKVYKSTRFIVNVDA